jgi:Na+(H+)/acetate symporter ActP
MGEFTYINIYATKGVEYLWIVGYLLVLVALAPMLLKLGRSDSDRGGEE